MAKCHDVIIQAAAAAGVRISQAKAADILTKIHNEAVAIADARHSGIYDKGVKEAATRYIANLLYAQEKKVRAGLLDIAAGRKIAAMARRFKEAGFTLGEGMEAWLNGSGRKIVGVGLHMDRVATQRWYSALGGYMATLEKAKLMKLDAGGTVEDEVWHELWELSMPSPRPGGVTGNASALAIAQARMRARGSLDATLHAAGDINRKRPGWAVPQSWSQERLLILSRGKDGIPNSTLGFRRWRATVLPEIDALETFRGENPTKWLRSFWENIHTGEFKSGTNQARTDSGNVGALSEGRKMVFTTSEGALRVNKAFGEHGGREGFLKNIKAGMEHATRLEYMGGDPGKAWQAVSSLLTEEAKGMPDAKLQSDSINKASGLRIAFMIASGETDMPGNVKEAKRLGTMQALLVLASQGGTILSAVPGDLVSSHMQATRFGFSPMAVYMEGLLRIMGLGSEAGKQHMKGLGIGLAMFPGLGKTRVAPHESAGQWLAKGTELLFKLNFVSPWTDAMRRAATGSMLSQLGDFAAKDFDAQLPATKALFDKYDIDTHAWEFMRHTLADVDGMGNIITGELNRLIPTATATALKAKYGASYERVLKERLDVMMSGEAHMAVLETGDKERKWSTLGSRAGTVQGAAIRMVMFMKSFPIAMVTKQLAEERAHGSKTRLLAYTAYAMALGYATILVGDTIKGKKPKPFTDQDGDFQWSIIKDSLQRSGMYGVVGDLFLQEYDKGFRTLGGYLIGPMVQKIGDPLASALNKGVRGELTGAELSDVAGLIPYNNLLYTRALYDHTIGWSLREFANPGAKQKATSNLKRNYNQEYYEGVGPRK